MRITGFIILSIGLSDKGGESINGFKWARVRAGLRQEDAAKLLGVSQPTLSTWECGKGTPTAGKLLNVARFYRVSVEDLMAKEVEFGKIVVDATGSRAAVQFERQDA